MTTEIAEYFKELTDILNLQDELHAQYMELAPKVSYHWAEYDRLSDELHALELQSDAMYGKDKMHRFRILTWINEQPEADRKKWLDRLEGLYEFMENGETE